MSGKDRYFNQIDVPHFWEIDASGNDGGSLIRGSCAPTLITYARITPDWCGPLSGTTGQGGFV